MILGYCRVSTQSQADESKTSLLSQEGVIRGYAMAKGKTHEDVEMFIDAGISGGMQLRKRPQGALLLKTAKRGDIVVASKLDRMFRNSTDALVTTEECKERGIHLVMMDLSIEPITSDGVGKFILTIFAALADMERTRIAERIKEGKLAKQARGGATYRIPPFGWRKVGVGRHSVLEIDEREQQVIELVKQGRPKKTYKQIARDIEEAGYRNRAGKPYADCFLFRVGTRLEAQAV